MGAANTRAPELPFIESPRLAQLAGMSRGELQALQLRKLRRQLLRLRGSSGYYRKRLDAACIEPDELSSLEAFHDRFPLSTKADFLADQTEHPAFGERSARHRAREDVAMVNMTGGTSGQGQEIYGRSQSDIHKQGYLHALPWVLAGLRPGDVAINCVPAGGADDRRMGTGRGSADHWRDGVSRRRRAVDGRQDRPHAADRRGSFYLRLDKLSAYPDGGFTAARHRAGQGFSYDADAVHCRRRVIRWNGPNGSRRCGGCRLQEGYGSTQCAGFGASTCAGRRTVPFRRPRADCICSSGRRYSRCSTPSRSNRSPLARWGSWSSRIWASRDPP